MARFIEADVIQKIATEAEWLTQTRIPYQGQIMIVGDSSGKVTNIKVGDGVNTFANLNYMFDSIQQNAQYVPITSNALPTPVADPAWGMVTGGTYTFGGVDVFTVPVGHWGIANYSSGVWSLVDMGELPFIPVNGVVEEGNTQAVSGGEVFDKYGDITYFSEKGKYTSAANSTIVNESLETTDYIDISKLDSISGYGRGTSTVPMIIYYDNLNNVVGTVMGNSNHQAFNILKQDFPLNAVKIKINALLNYGVLNKAYIQEVNDRISASDKIRIKSINNTYVNTSGVEVYSAIRKVSQLFPIDKSITTSVYNASTDGDLIKPILFYDISEQLIGYIDSTTPAIAYNVDLDATNIPENTYYIRVQSLTDNDVYIITNTDILLANLSTKKVDTSNLVTKESGKGLYPYSDKNKVDRLIIDGIGTKALFDDGEYKEITISGDVVIENKINQEDIVSNVVTVGKLQTKKPKVVLTFDDGRLTDYTHVKPLLDTYDVKGVFYTNKFDVLNKLTTSMIQEMYQDGHEFGSHTLNHRIFSGFAVIAPINAEDTILKITSPYSSPGFITLEENEVMPVWANFDGVRVEANVISTWEADGFWWAELESPIGMSKATNTEFYNSEENAVWQSKQIKDRLEYIGVECHGFAYPYGNSNETNKIAMQQLFSYARKAQANNSDFRIFGGVDSKNYNDFFDQYSLYAIEIPNLTYAQIDEHINNVITNRGVLVFLGHSTDNYSYDMYPKLIYIIEKCQSLGVDITTMYDALKSHGNLLNNSYSNINSEGLSYNNGVTVLPPNFLANLESTHNYPIGLSTQRVYSGQENNYPEVGTVIRLNTAHKNSEKTHWTYDYFIGYTTGYLYFRKRNGTFIATDWECLSTRKGTVFPTTILTVGCSFYRTDLKKMFYYDGSTWRDALGDEISN